MSASPDDGARPALEIAIQNPARYGGSNALSVWLRRMLREVAPESDSFGVLLTNDAEVAELNERFRARAEPTDVLSFPGDDGDTHLGDVVISIPTASEQAALHGHPLDRELEILLLHGVLHCLGYDHETDDGEMAALEAELAERWISPSSLGASGSGLENEETS